MNGPRDADAKSDASLIMCALGAREGELWAARMCVSQTSNNTHDPCRNPHSVLVCQRVFQASFNKLLSVLSVSVTSLNCLLAFVSA